ncbi:4Fe-4S dicluster domain-containing protein [bacterium]|nr:4Fe-4S dicluster domain-containing protein [bacterium]
MTPETKLHSIQIDNEKCIGCVLCMRACPMKAIRIRNDKAVIDPLRCVDCGECYRVCPHDAVIPETTSFSYLKKFKYTVALPSPVLYMQFGWEVMPNQVLQGLKRFGFDYVYDVAWMCENVTAAYEVYMQLHPTLKPKISTVCPAVVRLITHLYPDLLNHFIPIESPRELAAKRLRFKLAIERNLKPEEIGIIHITSCAAKMVSVNHPVGLAKSHLDGVVSIKDIYGDLLDLIEDVEEDVILQKSSGVGLGWAQSGGEIRGMNLENALAVSGVSDVIRILDDAEAGRLRNIDYLELLICPDGCIGGPMVVQNRHIAKQRCETLVKMFGEKSRVSRKMIRRLFNEGFYKMEEGIEQTPLPPLDPDPIKAIQKSQKIEELLSQLCGKECGACGSPDCRTLARDIVVGEARLTDCVFIEEEKDNP